MWWPFSKEKREKKYKKCKEYEALPNTACGTKWTVWEHIRWKEGWDARKAKDKSVQKYARKEGIDLTPYPYRFQNRVVELADIPFEGANNEVIFMEGFYHPRANNCVRKHLPLIRECMAKHHLRFVYLPMLQEEVAADADAWRYHHPGECTDMERVRETMMNDVKFPEGRGSSFLLDYMLRPENRPRVQAPSFARFNYSYRSVFDDFKTNRSYFELVFLDVKAAEKDPERYFSYMAARVGMEMTDFYGGLCYKQKARYEDADDAFSRDTQKMLQEVEYKIDQLRRRGVSEMILQQLVKPKVELSRLVVTADHRILLADYDNMEVRMEPLVKTVYLLFLRHPEGIRFKCLQDYRAELAEIYDSVKGGGTRSMTKGSFGTTRYAASIQALTDPLNNSINEKCARIREAFLLCINDAVAENYFITGQRGEPKGIKLPQNLVEWEGTR